MTIKPFVKLYMLDGTKHKIELYTRPPMLYLEVKKGDKTTFTRVGPDEYEQLETKDLEDK